MEFIPYPKIHALGYKGTEDLKDSGVFVSEKLDGSNVSIHRTEDGLRLASRMRWLDQNSKQFGFFLLWFEEHKQALLWGLQPGETLWGEFCNNHNVLVYGRKEPFVLFDFSYKRQDGEYVFIVPTVRNSILEDRNLSFIQSVSCTYFETLVDVNDHLTALNTAGSMLGGPVEGVVIKNYDRLSSYGQPLFVKIVNADFKEDFKKTYAIGDSLEEALCQIVFPEARFRKGVQRLKENETYTGTVTDIGNLIKVVQNDVASESLDTIKEFLYQKYWPNAKKLLSYKIFQRYKQEIGLGPKSETDNLGLRDEGNTAVSVASETPELPSAVCGVEVGS